MGNAEDLGGNRINVKWDTGMGTSNRNLHSVWDSAILQRAGITTEADGTTLNAEITAAELTAWQTFDIASWAEESLALARSHATHSLMEIRLLTAPRCRTRTSMPRGRWSSSG